VIARSIPAWFTKAKEIAARVKGPAPFVAAKGPKTCDVHLYDAIGRDDWMGGGIAPEDVIAAIKEGEGCDELAVHINSPGGNVFDGIAIANAIRGFKGKKTVYVDGIAASIASVIALAGDRVVMNPGSMMMVHDPAGGVFSFGTADQIEDDARKTVAALRKVRDNLVDIYTSETGKSASQVSAWMSAETWMTAEEAVDRGFADEVAAAAECQCDCPECEAGDCADCSCGGCEACAKGMSCDDGKCDQGGPKMKARPASSASAHPQPSIESRLELVTLQAKNRSERFSAASRGASGQPGTNQNTGNAGRK
jgi:ATP-dependent protease ClpP protease subunit